MNTEIQAMLDYKVIEELGESIDPQRNVIRTMFICNAKSEAGYVTRFKVRLVTRGDSQELFSDYEEDTYAPTSLIQDIRMLCGLSVKRQMYMFTFDVKTAFLNAPIDKEIYATMTAGYKDLASDGFPRIYKLHKALYGLKQSITSILYVRPDSNMSQLFRMRLFSKEVMEDPLTGRRRKNSVS